ncbi:hypothetical protein EON65_12075 [archaeon]|nr:MAG: hypothetical protein EON65_12075 [archaeon]
MIEPRFTLSNQDWQNFSSYVEQNYPLESFNHDEKEFVRKALLKDGKCSDVNKFWVTLFVDQLIDYIDEGEFMHVIDAKNPIPNQMQYLSLATCKALLGFFNAQHNLRLQVPHDQRTPEQQRMLEIHPNVENFPLQLTIDIGRLINVRQIAREHPNIESKSDLEEKFLFQKLHNQLEEVARMQMNKGSASVGDQQGSVSDEPVPEWHPHSVEDNYLRLCTLKVWCDKYEQEEQYSPRRMVTEWLQEAIQLYNNVSYHWPSCKIKQFPPQVFHDIQQTCIHGWLSHISERAGIDLHVKKPRTNFVTDWCTPPVTEHRQQWENYCCGVILQAKNIAKLMGRHEVITEDTKHLGMEGDSQQPPLKRSRSAGSKEENMDVGDDPSTELRNLVRSVVREELMRVERMIVSLNRNDYERSQEVMRELGGHISPVRTALQYLSSNINNISTFLDQMRQQKV